MHLLLLGLSANSLSEIRLLNLHPSFLKDQNFHQTLPMQIGIQTRPQFHSIRTLFITLKNPVLNQRSHHSQTSIDLQIESQKPTKRPICSSCSKPLRVCICSRFKSPLLDNSVSVTIIQHNKEKKHALNSTRIAALGLKNLTVVTDSNVSNEARFLIWLMKPGSGAGNEWKRVDFDGTEEPQSPKKPTFGSNSMNDGVDVDTRGRFLEDDEKILDFEGIQRYPEDRSSRRKGDFDKVQILITGNNLISELQDECGANRSCLDGIKKEGGPVVTATFTRCEFKPENDPGILVDFYQLLDTKIGQDLISNGFVVKKLRKKKLQGSEKVVEVEEYEIVVPPGSALLFPSKTAVELESVGSEVKHLFVLDGTWGKATRIYHENPWLRLLPHLKLNLNKISLYDKVRVRREPKEGYVSTIESIVYTLKALGDDHEELDDLLDVFESMLVDHRRFRDEKFSRNSQT